LLILIGTKYQWIVVALKETNEYNLELTDEQRELYGVIRKFVKDEIIPKAAHYDQTGEFPWPIIKKAHANGFMNTDIPTKYGGIGIDPISSVILYESIAYGCSGIGAAMLTNELAATPIIIGGSEELKKKYLPRFIKDPIMASYAVTEPGGGSDVAGIKTRSEKKGDEWIINGSKMWITNGGHANFYFVLTRSDPDPKVPASKAFTGFVVDSDTPGVIKGKKEIMLGQRTSDTRAITFEDVRVPASNVVGEPGGGFVIAMKTFDKTRPMVAAMANGVAARCLDEATKYALERKAFKQEIANFQGVSFMLAEMAMHLELSRLMAFKGAYELHVGRPGSYYSSIAKCFAADTAMAAALNTVQIFGGNGYCTEYPAEKLMRDAKIFQIYEGTSQIQRLVIARRLIERSVNTGTASATL
uniref:Acyl-CoA dehydrogenase n=1 Tax=Enterobius vermicularis TaxID=51028 RepID=A0A0N4VKR5_ENTVE